jgi:hypothetical protein
MTVGYALPIGGRRRVLWYPAPRLVWGELKEIGDEIIILSPDPAVKLNDIPMLTHDNVFRPDVRMTGWVYRYYWMGRLMLWGLIWLLGMDRPVEDIIGGVYLLLGLPFFIRLMNDVIRSEIKAVQARFETLFYHPKITVVYSPRLAELEWIIEQNPLDKGSKVLERLDELGFQHLREFYKRVAWQGRWETPPPTGAGVLE